ncbi:MAG: right-handed parallel beta-helix repeat-containing protein, partial [Methanospirillum sp.]|uniref:right-handed parallel beta-helix repeat-containing protein n=1 Tax=Methanospirillum sp. TaxID=45200 RepID=UPI002372E854
MDFQDLVKGSCTWISHHRQMTLLRRQIQRISAIFLIFALMALHAGATSGEADAPSHIVIITSTQGGTVYPDGANTIPDGSNITITITPAPGYRIGRVLTDGVDNGPVPTLIISPVVHDTVVHAIFVPESDIRSAWTSLPPVPTTTVAEVQEPVQAITPEKTGSQESAALLPSLPLLPNSSGSISVGGAGADYGRIQDAIDHATPGATISIAPGTYREQLIITRPLTLIGGEGAEQPVISAEQNGTAILITANQVSLQNLKITGAVMGENELIGAVSGTAITDLLLDRCTITDSQNGVVLTSSDQVSILQSNITNIRRNGISLTSGKRVTIEQSAISRCLTGIRGENLTSVLMHDTRAYDNADDGVWFYALSDSILSKNIIAENSNANSEDDAPSYTYGLALIHGENVTVTDNRLVHNWGIAFLLDEPHQMTITNNTLTNNTVGFSYTGTIPDPLNHIEPSNTIDKLPLLYYEGKSGLIIENVTPATVYLQNCTDITIRNISLNSRNGYGIVAKEGRNLSILNTNVRKNLNQNILITGVTSGTITDCGIEKGTTYGLGLLDATDFTIFNNQIRDNNIGIALRGSSSRVNLSGNDFSGNTEAFQIGDGYASPGFGEFSNNTITNGSIGITSLNGGGGQIHHNQIITGTGMSLNGSQNLQIEDNQIRASTVGIGLSRSDSVSGGFGSSACFKNRIIRNQVTGGGTPILVANSSDWIFGNTIYLNDFITAPQGEINSGSAFHYVDNASESWGGVNPTPPVTEQNQDRQADPVDASNIWDTGERVRYTYENSTFSGYLGNHWSVYTGKEIGASGIGDTPYQISAD